MKLYCLFFIRQGDSGEETGSVREHSAENHINVSNCTRNYNPLLQISAYLSHCCSSVLRVMNRKTSTATHFCILVDFGLLLCFFESCIVSLQIWMARKDWRRQWSVAGVFHSISDLLSGESNPQCCLINLHISFYFYIFF